MKKSFLFFFVALMFAGCGDAFKTKGPVTTEKRDITGFHAINSDAVGEIVLVHDSNVFVEVNTNQNLLPYVETTLDGSTLHISQKKDFRFPSNTKIKVTVHASAIDEISLSGVGSIKTENSFSFNKITLSLDGVGSMNISGSAHQAELNNNGAGSINTKSLAADTVHAVNSGVGSIACNAIKFLRAEVSGVGSISYTGDPVLEKSVSGVGSVHKE
jgi:hypothetical protein